MFHINEIFSAFKAGEEVIIIDKKHSLYGKRAIIQSIQTDGLLIIKTEDNKTHYIVDSKIKSRYNK